MPPLRLQKSYEQLVEPPVGPVQHLQLRVFDVNGLRLQKDKCYHSLGTDNPTILAVRSFVGAMPSPQPTTYPVTANVDLVIPMSATFLGRNGLELPQPYGQYVKTQVQNGCHQVLPSDLGDECEEVSSTPKWTYVTDKSLNSFAYICDQRIGVAPVPPPANSAPKVLQLYEGAGTLHQAFLMNGFEVAVVASKHWNAFKHSYETNQKFRDEQVGIISEVTHCENLDRPLNEPLHEWLDALRMINPPSAHFTATKNRMWGNANILVTLFSRLFQMGYHGRCSLDENYVVVQTFKTGTPLSPRVASQYVFESIAEAEKHLKSDLPPSLMEDAKQGQSPVADETKGEEE